MHLPDADLLSPLSQCDLIASSTPNLMVSDTNGGSQCGTLGRGTLRPHCYTNAAPQRVEGNVFRFDFSEQVTQPKYGTPAKKSSRNSVLLGRRTGDQSKSETKIVRRHYQIDRKRWPHVEAGQFDSGRECSGDTGHEESTADGGSDEEANHTAGLDDFDEIVCFDDQTKLGFSSFQIGTNSMRRKGGPISLTIQNHNENVYGNTQEHSIQVRIFI